MNGTVRVASDGSITWHGESAVALGPVLFEVDGFAFTIDAARCDEVVDLFAPDAEALHAVSQWFADPAAIEAIAEAADGAVLPGPIAGGALARVATVEAVDSCYVGDLNESILELDHGFAGQSSGDERRAARGYGFAPATVELLLEETEIADYSGPLNERIIEVVRSAPSYIFDDDEKRDLLAGVRERVAAADGTWDLLLAEPARARDAALSLGSAIETRSETADLRMLPPRLLTFTVPNEPEISVERTGDGLTVTATLRDNVIRDSAEATGVFVVAADRETGALLAHAPARVIGDRLEAVVDVTGLDPERLRCGLIGSDASLDALRLDSVGVRIAEIDRYCRYAWTEHRRAGAILASVGAASGDDQIDRARISADRARRAATRAVRNASTRCGSLIEAVADPGPDHPLRKFQAAVDRLGGRIAEAPAIDGPDGPTLAELHAVTLG